MKAAQALTCCPDQHFEPTNGSPDQCVRYCTKSFSRYPGTEPFIIGFLQPRIVGVNPTNIMYTTYKNRGYTGHHLAKLHITLSMFFFRRGADFPLVHQVPHVLF